MKIQSVLASKGPRVFTIAPDRSIREAAAMLADANVGALIVMGDAPEPAGILSERDIVRRLNVDEGCLNLRVEDVMSRNVICGAPDDDVDAVLQTMTSKRFRHLPIVENGRLIGMVTTGDLVAAQLMEYRGEVETLEQQLMSS